MISFLGMQKVDINFQITGIIWEIFIVNLQFEISLFIWFYEKSIPVKNKVAKMYSLLQKILSDSPPFTNELVLLRRESYWRGRLWPGDTYLESSLYWLKDGQISIFLSFILYIWPSLKYSLWRRELDVIQRLFYNIFCIISKENM